MKRSRRPIRHVRRLVRPRAVGFIWFFTVAIYFFFLAAFFSVDVSAITSAHNEVTLAAESAALAAAAQATLNVNTYYLDLNAATTAATQTFQAEYCGASAPPCHSSSMPRANINMQDVQVTVVSGPGINPNTVTVTVKYKVPGLIFAGFFTTDQPTFTTQAIAFLCIPGTATVTGGDCVPPIGK
jgi:Flp pilus assembly protein TadG